MKHTRFLAAIFGAIRLACLCSFANGADKPFQPLLDQIDRQQGWASDYEKVAETFYRCLDSIPKNKEKAVIEFVGNDDDRVIGLAITWRPGRICMATRPQPSWLWPSGPRHQSGWQP